LHNINSAAIIYLTYDEQGPAKYNGYASGRGPSTKFPYFNMTDFIKSFTLFTVEDKKVTFEGKNIPWFTKRYYYLDIHSLFEEV